MDFHSIYAGIEFLIETYSNLDESKSMMGGNYVPYDEKMESFRNLDETKIQINKRVNSDAAFIPEDLNFLEEVQDFHCEEVIDQRLLEKRVVHGRVTEKQTINFSEENYQVKFQGECQPTKYNVSSKQIPCSYCRFISSTPTELLRHQLTSHTSIRHQMTSSHNK